MFFQYPSRIRIMTTSRVRIHRQLERGSGIQEASEPGFCEACSRRVSRVTEPAEKASVPLSLYITFPSGVHVRHDSFLIHDSLKISKLY